jgi:hypothetical protein
MSRMRPRPIIVLLGIATFLTLAPTAVAGCIERHSVPIAKGTSPSGETWTVEGSIGNNGGCGEWLFGMDFDLPKVSNWTWGTGIPAGGHLTQTFKLDASDFLQEDGTTRVFSGTAGGAVARIVATLSDGEHISIKPRSPSAKLRRAVAWLRNVRYFVRYYPPDGFVTSVSLLDSSGQLVYRTSGAGGSFS